MITARRLGHLTTADLRRCHAIARWDVDDADALSNKLADARLDGREPPAPTVKERVTRLFGTLLCRGFVAWPRF